MTARRAVMAGSGGCAPEQLFGVRQVRAGPGWAQAEMIAASGAGPGAPLPPGSLGMLADVALGRAVLTTVPAGGGCRTATLSVDFTAEAAAAGETLTARGEVIARHGSLSLAVADIRTSSGRLAARASGWFAVLEVDPARAAGPVSGAVTAPVPPADLAQLQELVRLAGGVTGTDGFGLSLRTRPEMANRQGTMHGGMQAVLAAGALTATAGTATADTAGCPDPGLVRLELTLHRPVPADGTSLHAAGRVLRAGRRVLAATAAFSSPAGSLLISATGTFDASGHPARSSVPEEALPEEALPEESSVPEEVRA